MKKKIHVLMASMAACILCIGNVQAQVPANDDCANAEIITVGAPPVSGNNTNATLDGPSGQGCWDSAPDNDIWYTFTTGAAGAYEVTTSFAGSGDTQIKLYSGGCGALVEIGCDDQGGTVANTSRIAMELNASTTYHVQTDIYGTGTGTVNIAVNTLPTASNAMCANATVLTVGDPFICGSNTNAYLEAGELATAGCWFTGADHTIWYTFTTGAAGMYEITTDDPGTDDSQIKLYSGTCGSMTEIACDDDGGVVTGLASVITTNLAASTQYWIQLDAYGTAVRDHCIRVYKLQVATNDCVLNATDITFLINPLGTSNPYECSYGYIYNQSPSTFDDPTRQDIQGDPNGCNGVDATLNPRPAHYDIWFKFDVTLTTPNAYLHLFPNQGTAAILAMGLYSGTPVAICPTGQITGLSQIDCSTGEVVDLPPANIPGGARDKSVCSTPVHSRLDISGLAPGTYYIRVWDFGGSNPPDMGTFNLCAESPDPRPYTSDDCPGGANIGYMGVDLNVDVNSTYTKLSNAGAIGNAYGAITSNPQVCTGNNTNEPFLGATPAGDARQGCAGGWITYVGTINNIMNVTVIHSFTVNACPGCEPIATVTLNNIKSDGIPGFAAQLQVMAPGNCTGSTQTVMNASTTDNCIEMRPSANAPLPNGTYYIVVDGQDGQLLEYDLTLELDYPCGTNLNLSGGPCFVLPIHLVDIDVVNQNISTNRVTWTTASEINNDYFLVERSLTGSDFKPIGRVEGVGNSKVYRQYSYFDNQAPAGLAYYRLKQVDFNGEFSYSKIVSVENNRVDPSIISIAAGQEGTLKLEYLSPEAGMVQVRLYDLSGAFLVGGTAEIHEGLNQVTIDAPRLSSGIYITEVVSELSQVTRKRFVLN